MRSPAAGRCQRSGPGPWPPRELRKYAKRPLASVCGENLPLIIIIIIIAIILVVVIIIVIVVVVLVIVVAIVFSV